MANIYGSEGGLEVYKATRFLPEELGLRTQIPT
jgi:hypothetical protein